MSAPYGEGEDVSIHHINKGDRKYMKFLKLSAVALFALGAVGLVVPGTVLAAKGGNSAHAHKVKVEFGNLDAYSAGSSATINGVTVVLTKHTKLIAEDAAASTAGPTVGDSAAAFVRWHKGTEIAKKLEYGTTSFAFKKKHFSGRYVSNDATTLTIKTKSSHHTWTDRTFNTDSNTKYFDNGKSVSTPTYSANERVNVRGLEMTDGTWYAAVVKLLHNTKGGGK